MPDRYLAHELAALLATYPNYLVTIATPDAPPGWPVRAKTCSINHLNETIKIGPGE